MKNDNKARKRREIRESLKQSIIDWCRKANELYRGKGIKIEVPKVYYRKMNVYGRVMVFGYKPSFMVLNSDRCFKASGYQNYLDYTIPHEIAHLIQVELLRKKFGRGLLLSKMEPHSLTWKSVMKRFKVGLQGYFSVNTPY